jgi:hypothetical protein
LDGTPLLGVRTGIGRYVEHLVAELATMSDDVARCASRHLASRRRSVRSLPAVFGWRHRPVPARLLHRAWLHGWPPDGVVYRQRGRDPRHNFVLPPPRRAAGVVTSTTYVPALFGC